MEDADREAAAEALGRLLARIDAGEFAASAVERAYLAGARDALRDTTVSRKVDG